MLLLLSALEGMSDILSIEREKGSKIQSLVPCPKVVQLYDSGMGGVDFMDQRTAAYRLDQESSRKFWKRAVPMSRLSMKKNQPELIDNHGGHLPDYQAMQKECAY